MKTKNLFKIIALAVSVLMVMASFPICVMAEAGDFVPENLFQTHLESKHEAVYYSWANGEAFNDETGTFGDVARFNSRGALDASVDGDLTVPSDVYAYSETSTNLIGARYHLDAAYYVGSVVLYSGYANNNDVFRVYASDTLRDLYSASNLVDDTVVCAGSGTTVKVDRTVQYFGIIFDSLKTLELGGGDHIARVFEFQAWSADESAVFHSENVFRTQLKSVTGMNMFVTTGNVEESTRFNGNGAIAASTDGNCDTATDIYGALDWSPSRYVGAVYELNDTVYADHVTIYSGFDTMKDTWRVYAANSLEDLYSAANMKGEVVCGNAGVDVAIKDYVKYVAFFCTDFELYNIRLKEFELWTGDETAVFRSENVLPNAASSRCIQFYPTSHYVGDASKISAATIATFADGDTTTTTDCSTGLDWDPPRYIGVEYTLDCTYYIGELNIYSGYTTSKDTFDVYASDSFDTLYNASSCVAEGVVCEGSKVTLKLNKEVRYVTFLISGIELYYARIAEFQLWTGDPNAEEEDTAENLFQTSLSETQSIAMSVIDSAVSENGRFDQNGVIAASVDGNLDETREVWGALDWEYPIYPGALYSLNDNAFADRLVIYAEGAFKVYAGDAMDTLYTNYNCVSEFGTTTKTGTVIEIGRYVKYIAIFSQDGADVAEFQLWSGTAPEEEPEKDPNVLSVLTIGNSFSENTSIYASEIANANGKALTFGYLKYPSCTLAKHLEAATNDMAVFKFQVVSPNGERKTYGTEAPSWASNSGSYTVAQALDFMDWDVIVFQQGSYDARSAESFNALPGLVAYVSEHAPNAKLMFHEVWSWGSWDHSIFETIKNNTENAARDCGLEIIPTGIAFEYVREAVNDYHYPNENDGHYQHANTYGQYIAGVCYVNALFGIECDPTAFARHPYINADGRVAVLTACANQASRYYHSYGDVDFDGNINADDCVMLKAHLLGQTVSNLDATLADANNDGVIDVRDLVRIKKTVAAE